MAPVHVACYTGWIPVPDGRTRRRSRSARPGVSRAGRAALAGIVVAAVCSLVPAAPAAAQPAFHAAAGLSTNVDWARLVLEDGGWPTTTDNVTVLLQWMASEEPPAAWWNGDNPLNNGLDAPGGVYPDLATAAYEVAVNLDAGDDGYPAIVADLGASAPPTTTARAIWASAWAAGHYGAGALWWSAAVPTEAAPPSAWVASGELLQVASSGQVVEVVGGAAVEVPAADVALLEGSPPVPPLDVPASTVALLAAVPANGTVVTSVQTGDTYVVAGGAALYLPGCPAGGTSAVPAGCSGAVPVDQWDLDHRGSPGAGFTAAPAGGTLIADGRTGQLYVVAGGAPVAVSSAGALGPSAPAPVVVAHWDLVNAGVAGIRPFEALARRPADGTLLETGTGGARFEVDAAGAAVHDPGATGTPVVVDPVAVARAGSGGVWDHLANDPPVVAFTPAQVVTADPTVVVHYPRPLLSSALAAMSVRYRLGPTGGLPGVWRMPAAWRMTGAPAVTYAGLAVGQTVCFEVRATDVDGVASAWTGDRCWSRP